MYKKYIFLYYNVVNYFDFKHWLVYVSRAVYELDPAQERICVLFILIAMYYNCAVSQIRLWAGWREDVTDRIIGGFGAETYYLTK